MAIRPATISDAGEIADVFLASFRAAYEFPSAHQDDDVRAWIRDVVVPAGGTWVAADGGPVVAMLVLGEASIDQLYVAPDRLGQGIGSRLVDLAKRRRPGGLELWTFQVNGRARRFYERHGFVAVEQTDGHGNEERQPDVRYVWRPAGD